MRRYLSLVFIGAVLGMSASGCSKNFSLTGKVTYEDGTPITAGMLNFESDSSLSRAKIQPDGTYVVGTLKEADGIPKGSYKIYITGAEVAIETDSSRIPQRFDAMGNPVPTMAAYRKLVHPKYMTTSQSPLSCEVPAKNNRFDFIVEPPVF